MAESSVSLPPSSTGQAMRLITDGGALLMPASVAEEAVVVTDYNGLPAGDGRQRPTLVSIDRIDDIVLGLQQIQWLLVELLSAAGTPTLNAFNNYTESLTDNPN